MRSKLVTRWIGLTIVVSLVAAVDGGWLASWASLAPDRIVQGEVWRLVTWPFVEVGPTALIVTCLAIYKFGGELVLRWGDRRLGRYTRHVVLASALVTCVVAVVTRATLVHRLGGWAITDALVIAWARQYPTYGLHVYGLVTLRGQQIVQLTVASSVLFAVFYGPIAVMPELVACGVAASYPSGWLRA